MGNRYCKALGIAPPRVEDHRPGGMVKLFHTMVVALLEHGEPLTLEALVGRLDSARWAPFGTPPPSLTRGPGGVAALSSQGDGSYTSGVYSRRALSAIDGVGAEVRFSSPITSDHWQLLEIRLDGGLDSVALAQWDHRTGTLPRQLTGGGSGRYCSVEVPAGEGLQNAAQAVFLAGEGTGRAALSPPQRSGRWYRVRVQVFPDGRCGVALDGRPVWHGRRPIGAQHPFHLVLQGNSVGTRMLFGPVEVWQGVKGDVDWSKLEPRASPRQPPSSTRHDSIRRISGPGR